MVKTTKKELIEKQIARRREHLKYCRIIGFVGIIIMFCMSLLVGLLILIPCVWFEYTTKNKIEELEVEMAEN